MSLRNDKNESYWNGFILGFFIGGISSMIILNLIQKAIL